MPPRRLSDQGVHRARRGRRTAAGSCRPSQVRSRSDRGRLGRRSLRTPATSSMPVGPAGPAPVRGDPAALDPTTAPGGAARISPGQRPRSVPRSRPERSDPARASRASGSTGSSDADLEVTRGPAGSRAAQLAGRPCTERAPAARPRPATSGQPDGTRGSPPADHATSASSSSDARRVPETREAGRETGPVGEQQQDGGPRPHRPRAGSARATAASSALAARRQVHLADTLHHGDLDGGPVLVLVEVHLGHHRALEPDHVPRAAADSARRPARRAGRSRSRRSPGKWPTSLVVGLGGVVLDGVADRVLVMPAPRAGVATTCPVKVEPVVPVSCTCDTRRCDPRAGPPAPAGWSGCAPSSRSPRRAGRSTSTSMVCAHPGEVSPPGLRPHRAR